jgi:hypothetical protein
VNPHPDPTADHRPTIRYWIRVAGVVGERLLGTSYALEAADVPASTILLIESDVGTADLVASLHARGLEVLTVSQVG